MAARSRVWLVLSAFAIAGLLVPTGAGGQRLPPRAHAVPAPAATAPAMPRPAAPQPPQPDLLIAGHDLEVGTFYFHRGDYVGALARYEDAIYNDPSSAEAYCRAGDAESKLKHALSARDDWRRCLQLAESGRWAARARTQLKKHTP